MVGFLFMNTEIDEVRSAAFFSQFGNAGKWFKFKCHSAEYSCLMEPCSEKGMSLLFKIMKVEELLVRNKLDIRNK